MTDPCEVVIAVLTCRSPDDLAALLPALERQVAGIEARTFDVIVVDTDPDQSARELVQAYPWDMLRYIHEPQPGVARARNRALTEAARAQLLVFIDDDGRPSKPWLSSLLAMHDRTGAAAVTGPVVSDHDGEPNAWLTGVGASPGGQVLDGHELPAAGTGNLLLDLRQVRRLGLTFDDHLGLSDGSDIMFTRQLVKGGGRIVYAASAGITANVPAARLTRAERLKRSYLLGSQSALRRAYRRGRKLLKRLLAHLRLSVLHIRNLTTKQPVVGTCEVIVSLTSFSARIGTVAYAIESLARGTARPSRMILWLADNEQLDRLPASLERLRRRGLEVRTCPDYGSHKKYFPALTLALADQLPIVTADDDILYPARWLEHLAKAGERNPGMVSCYRASRIRVSGGKIAAYTSWPRCRDDLPGFDVFPTSGAGVYYPLPMVQALIDAGEAFLERAPKADDIWLHWVAVRSGIRMRQIFHRAQLPPATPGTQQVSLMTENVFGGRNDRYVQALYDESDIARISGGGVLPPTC